MTTIYTGWDVDGDAYYQTDQRPYSATKHVALAFRTEGRFLISSIGDEPSCELGLDDALRELARRTDGGRSNR